MVGRGARPPPPPLPLPPARAGLAAVACAGWPGCCLLQWEKIHKGKQKGCCCVITIGFLVAILLYQLLAQLNQRERDANDDDWTLLSMIYTALQVRRARERESAHVRETDPPGAEREIEIEIERQER